MEDKILTTRVDTEDKIGTDYGRWSHAGNVYRRVIDVLMKQA